MKKVRALVKGLNQVKKKELKKLESLIERVMK